MDFSLNKLSRNNENILMFASDRLCRTMNNASMHRDLLMLYINQRDELNGNELIE